MTVLNLVMTDADDVFRESTAGGLSNTSNPMNVDHVDEHVGIRFQNVTIAQGSRITDAQITAVLWGTGGDEPDHVIVGEDVDDAPVWDDASATYTFDISERLAANPTSAKQYWFNTNVGANSNRQNLGSNVKWVLQEIIDRPGWVSGNAAAFFLSSVNGTGTRDVDIQTPSSSGVYPHLNVTYDDGDVDPARSKIYGGSLGSGVQSSTGADITLTGWIPNARPRDLLVLVAWVTSKDATLTVHSDLTSRGTWTQQYLKTFDPAYSAGQDGTVSIWTCPANDVLWQSYEGSGTGTLTDAAGWNFAATGVLSLVTASGQDNFDTLGGYIFALEGIDLDDPIDVSSASVTAGYAANNPIQTVPAITPTADRGMIWTVFMTFSTSYVLVGTTTGDSLTWSNILNGNGFSAGNPDALIMIDGAPWSGGAPTITDKGIDLDPDPAFSQPVAGFLISWNGLVAAGPTQVSLAGNQPSSTGSLSADEILQHSALTGNQPSAAGSIAAVKSLEVAGDQPSAAGGLTQWKLRLIQLAGSQPAASGDLTVDHILQHVGLGGNQPSATGNLIKALYELLAGSQPNATGSLSVDEILRHIGLAGSQPNASGALTADEILQHVVLTGSQPAGSGELAVKLYELLAGDQPSGAGELSLDRLLQHVALVGDQPAATGGLAVDHILQHVGLVGSQPTATGSLAALQMLFRSLAGDQPAASGTIDAVASVFKLLEGDQPAASGSLAIDEILRHISLVGDQPAATGGLTKLQSLLLEGDQPTASGALSLSWLAKLLAGDQPNATGALAIDLILRHIALAGSQPAASGEIAFRSLVAVLLVGDQPAATGTLIVNWIAKFLSGEQPAATGEITTQQFKLLEGDQPAASGSLLIDRILQHVGLAGDQPAASGDLSKLVTKLLVGDQPSSSGVLAAAQTLARQLTGDQPTATGTLTFDRLLQHVVLSGSQPAAEGGLAFNRMRQLEGDQPAASGELTQLLMKILEGSQPAASGSLSVYSELYRLLVGSQPAASGTLGIRVISALVAIVFEAIVEYEALALEAFVDYLDVAKKANVEYNELAMKNRYVEW